MKKIILILLAALPVLIVFFTAIGAGVIIAEIRSFPVESVELDYEKLEEAGQKAGPSQNIITLDKGGSLNLRDYITIYPAKAKFESLTFVSKEPDVVDVEDGVLKAKKYMRSYTRIPVEIRNDDGLKTLITLNVRVRSPEIDATHSSIDYIGFNMSAYLGNHIFGQYCSVEDGKLIIDRTIMNDGRANDKFDVLEGLAVGPRESYDVVADTYAVTGDALEHKGQSTYAVVSTGTAAVTASFNGMTATLEIIIR